MTMSMINMYNVNSASHRSAAEHVWERIRASSWKHLKTLDRVLSWKDTAPGPQKR